MTSSARDLRSALQEGTGKEIFLPHEGIDTTSLRSVRFSDAQIMIREGSQYVIDPVARNSDIRPEIQTGDVRTLASKLRTANPLLYGLLECRGAVKFLDTEQKITSYGIVFKFPKDMVEPKSLRWLLVHDGCSLSAKIGLAKHLAKALSYVHTYGFVHKSIRPETILVFSSGDTSAPFLLGFERFRLAEGRTWRRGDRMWKDLYRHPSRQGVTPEEDYVMQHDIYSLGVCLLEVGLWQSFLAYPSEGVPDSEPIPQIGQGTASPSRAKDELLSMARNQLPRLMGDKYTRVVINCLTCLDEDNLDFQDENQFLDADGVLIGVRYIQKVSSAMTVASEEYLEITSRTDTHGSGRDIGMIGMGSAGGTNRCGRGSGIGRTINIRAQLAETLPTRCW